MTTNYLTSNPIILKEARNYIDGLMLGDGNIQCMNSKTGYYQHGCKYKNWLDKIDDNLYEYGIECKVNNGRLQAGGFGIKRDLILYRLWTRSYIEFKEMHDRWYRKDYNTDEYSTTRWHLDKKTGEYYIWKKIVPKDICLSPVCLANEYFGDGGTYKRKYVSNYRMILATNGFLREDTIFLAELLSDTLDINCGVNKSGVIQVSTQADISTFLSYIKDCGIPDCYTYKFPEELIK